MIADAEIPRFARDDRFLLPSRDPSLPLRMTGVDRSREHSYRGYRAATQHRSAVNNVCGNYKLAAVRRAIFGLLERSELGFQSRWDAPLDNGALGREFDVFDRTFTMEQIDESPVAKRNSDSDCPVILG